MEAELKILSSIGGNQNITQRVLAKETQLSLGAINVLLKKMIEKGLIKIEKLNARTVRYILAPNGVMEKAKKTYDYIRRTYESIMLMKGELERIVDEVPEGGALYLCGEEDEVYHMVVMLLNEIAVGKNIAVKKIESTDDINGKNTVVVWDDTGTDCLLGVKCINFLERII